VRLWDQGGKSTWVEASAHQDSVRSLVFSDTGRQLYSAGWDADCRVWQFPSRLHGSFLPGIVDSPFDSMAFCGEDNLVALGCLSGEILILSTNHPAISPRRWKAHNGVVRTVLLSPAGYLLFSGGDDGFLRIWDSYWGLERRPIGQHADWVCCMALAKDGYTLASGSADGQVRVWDLRPGRELVTCFAHAGRVTHLAWSDSGAGLLSAGWDGVIRVWSVDGNSMTVRKTLDFGIGRVNCVAVNPDGMTAAAGGQDGRVVLWDLDDLDGLRF
jgi:WD40 repeat protein